MYNDLYFSGYNPYNNPAMMSNRPPNYNTNMQLMQNVLKGRVVSNIEEARSALIDMDGSITFFPCLSDNCIYTKSIGLDGQAIFKVYRLVENNSAIPEYADMNTVRSLEERIALLEGVLKDKEKENVKSNA